jgi:large subunit ribosomal protein L21
MKLAVIKTGGKQYVVSPGTKLKVEKLDAKQGAKLKLDTLLVSDGNSAEIGKPVVKTGIQATILQHGRGTKIRVIKYKAKTRYKRTLGHRQDFTQLEIANF